LLYEINNRTVTCGINGYNGIDGSRLVLNPQRRRVRKMEGGKEYDWMEPNRGWL